MQFALPANGQGELLTYKMYSQSAARCCTDATHFLTMTIHEFNKFGMAAVSNGHQNTTKLLKQIGVALLQFITNRNYDNLSI